jgi:hypothetical protein
VIQNPFSAFSDIKRLRKKFVNIQDFDAFVAHGVRKDVMILLRLFDPEHVIKQQILAVFRREAAVRKTGPAYDYLPQCACF